MHRRPRLGKTGRGRLTIGLRYCISLPSRQRRGGRSEVRASPVPADECARGHGRARVNKSAVLLGAGVLPRFTEDLCPTFRPREWANNRRSISPMGAPGVKGRGMRHRLAKRWKRGAGRPAHLASAWVGCVPCVPVHDPRRRAGKVTEVPARLPQA